MDYDIIVIGAGHGGYETAVGAARSGKRVLVVERDQLGGTCLNRGCIPTKALCRSAEAVETVRHASSFGITVGGDINVDFPAVMKRKDAVVAELRDGVATLLKDVDVKCGEAVFTPEGAVSVNGGTFTAPMVIVATGSAPARLPVPGAEMALTSDELLSLEALPESIVIIGGGVIGLEFASILAALGSSVTVLEFCPEVLPPFDAEVAKRLRMSLKRRGINIVTGACVTRICPGGQVAYEVKGKEKTVEAEAVLMAVGRRPVIPQSLIDMGALTERGALMVDDSYKVVFADGKVPADTVIYAIGDVNGRCMLAHAASAQGEVVLGHSRSMGVIPSAVFTMPECAMVGLTEQQCQDAGLEYKVGKATFRSNGKALAMGEPDGMVKVLVSLTDGRLLGCHIVGAHAADLVQEAATVMTAGLPATAIADAIHAHPTLGETLRAAL